MKKLVILMVICLGFVAQNLWAQDVLPADNGLATYHTSPVIVKASPPTSDFGLHSPPNWLGCQRSYFPAAQLLRLFNRRDPQHHGLSRALRLSSTRVLLG